MLAAIEEINETGIPASEACGFATPSGLNREIVQIHHKQQLSMVGEDD